MSNISKNIKYLRKRAGFTQETFAQELGIKRSLIGAYEEGRARPNFEYLLAMSKLFNQTAEAILKENLEQKLNHLPIFESPKIAIEQIDRPEITPVLEQVSPKKLILNSNFSNAIVVDDITNESFFKLIKNDSLQAEYDSVTLPFQHLDNLFIFKDLIEFSSKNSLVICQKEAINAKIADGEFYLLLLQDGRKLLRRTYDLTASKGCFLTSSNLNDIQPEEIATSQVLVILKFIGYLSTEMPKVQTNLKQLVSLTEQLQKEVERLKN